MLAVSVRPDGDQVAVASLDCQITFFDIRTGMQSGSVEGHKDLAYGRRTSDKITAKTMGLTKLVLVYSFPGAYFSCFSKIPESCFVL